MTELTLLGTLSRTPSGCAVRFERDYATDAADLWDAVTSPPRVARWLAEVSGDLRPGGTVHVHFDDGTAAMELLSCEPPARLAVRWRHGDDASSRVTLEVSSRTDGGARLVLVHDELTEQQAPEYAAGWHWHLDALGAALDGVPAPEWDAVFGAAGVEYRRQLSGGDHT